MPNELEGVRLGRVGPCGGLKFTKSPDATWEPRPIDEVVLAIGVGVHVRGSYRPDERVGGDRCGAGCRACWQRVVSRYICSARAGSRRVCHSAWLASFPA